MIGLASRGAAVAGGSSPPALPLYLDMLYGAASGGFIEVRQLGERRRQEFIPVRERGRAQERIRALAEEADTYVGVAPRMRQEGGKDAVTDVHVVWADVDTSEAGALLAAFD